MLSEIKNLLNRLVDEQKNLKKSELRALQSQINPHFLYNTLDSAVWAAESNKTDEVIDLIASLSDFYRLTLRSGMDVISFDTEISHVSCYLHIMDPGYNEINRRKIESNAALLHIPITVFETNIFDIANSAAKSPCYLCARMRRGHLYAKAKALGCNKIALGHHKSDVIETTLMAMMYGSQIQGMLPRLKSTNFEGMELIRPMYCILEADIIRWRVYNDLEFIQCACRFTENCTVCDNGGGGSKRQEIKTLIKRLKRDNPNLENNLFNSIHQVNVDTMVGYKLGGEEHSFLEKLC